MGKTKKKRSRISNDEIRAFRIVGRIFSVFFSVLLTILLIGVIVGCIVGTAFAVYCKEYLIDDDYDIVDLQYSLDMTSKIYYPVYEDIERTQLSEYVEMEDQRIHGAENRYWAQIQDMPKNLTNAFIAIEDKRFYEHGGVDFKRTLGATLQFLKGDKSYGGSTITQQLIKNITDERESTIQRKVTEISRAISLTEKKTKNEILEMYLNTIPLSHGNYGVAAAANYFFDKSVSELSLVECAALASIPKSPTKYDPERYPENNKERRETVLFEMLEQELISKEEYDEAINTELILNINREETVDIVYSYFTDELRREVQKDLMDEYGYTKEYAQQMILSGGLQIYATVDPYIQNIMEEVFSDESTFVKVDNGVQPESAMVVLDPHTGQVLGIVGGRGEKTENMTLNRATMSRRQIGSSIKPVSVYAPAMDKGLIDYGSVIDDTPVRYERSLGRYWPKNAPSTYDGKTTMAKALMVSKNTVAVKLIQEMTPQYSYDFLTKKLNVESLVETDIAEAPLALGGLTYGMTTLEVAGCYTMLANQDGVFSDPIFYTKVLDSKGNVILDNDKRQKREAVIDDTTAKAMTKLLTGVVSSGGTAKNITLKNKIDVAAKTGTTNDNYDVYFVGYTPYYLGATWFGYDINRSLAKFGKSQAMVGWDVVMNRIHERVFEQETELKTFDYDGLVKAQYCKDSGLKPGKYCNLDVRGSRVETGYFKNAPTKTCDVHVPMEYDTSTGSIASANCPADSVVTKAFVKVGDERIFKGNVRISDAKYTVMDLPDNYRYPRERTTAIYANMLSNGQYYGYVSNGDIPPNSYCTVHGYGNVDIEVNGGLDIDGESGAQAVTPGNNLGTEGNGGSGTDRGHSDSDIFEILGIPNGESDGGNGNGDNSGGLSNEVPKNDGANSSDSHDSHDSHNSHDSSDGNNGNGGNISNEFVPNVTDNSETPPQSQNSEHEENGGEISEEKIAESLNTAG